MGVAPQGLWPLCRKAAIFDFDGTLSSTAALWRSVDEEFLGMRGIVVDSEYQRTLAMLGFEEGARYTIERYGLPESVESICAEWNRMGSELYRKHAKLRPGAQDYIEALRSVGVPCALATTNDPDVLNSMRNISIDALFDVRVHGKEVGCGKDRPDIYVEAARRLGVDPPDCIVFEDIVPAARSAQTIGMLCCGVRANDPTQRVAELKKLADLWLDDWRDIRR